MPATEVSLEAPAGGPRQWARRARALFGPRYQPGVLVHKVREDLRCLGSIATGPASAEFSNAQGDIAFTVHEHLDSRFLMHMVIAEFALSFVPVEAALGSIAVRHRGALRRTAVDFELSRGANDAMRRVRDRLAADAQLCAALLPLDFTSCTLAAGVQAMELRLRHFGACEIVGTVPRFRRYIRLANSQREALLASFSSLRRVLQAPP